MQIDVWTEMDILLSLSPSGDGLLVSISDDPVTWTELIQDLLGDTDNSDTALLAMAEHLEVQARSVREAVAAHNGVPLT